MKFYHYIIILLVLLASSFSLIKLQFIGIEKPGAIEPYMNGIFQSSPPWRVDRAFGDMFFDTPIYLRKFPKEHKYFVTCKVGQIWLLDQTENSISRKMALDISENVFTISEAGMYDVAFHPEFDNSASDNKGFIYVAYSYLPKGLENPEGYSYNYNRLSRFKYLEHEQIIDPGSETVLIQHFDRQAWHNGGALFFDNQGFLNLSIGDEGWWNDRFGNSQIIDNRLFGGILRIDVDRNSEVSHPIRRYPVPGPPRGLAV